MDILEDLLEEFFGSHKRKGWKDSQHEHSGHNGQTRHPSGKLPITCPKCGAENNPADNFCATCRAELALNRSHPEFIKCSHCGSQNDQDKASCLSCGAPLSKATSGICPSCAATIPSGARFCHRCGQAVPLN